LVLDRFLTELSFNLRCCRAHDPFDLYSFYELANWSRLLFVFDGRCIQIFTKFVEEVVIGA